MSRSPRAVLPAPRQRGWWRRVPYIQVPKMLFFFSVCLCSLTMFNEVVLAKDDLYAKIGNKHMLEMKNTTIPINFQKAVLHEGYLARDCRHAYLHGRKKSGLYIIRPKYSSLLAVYCEMKYDGGGWTVLHRNNMSQAASWSHDWNAYKIGFGNLMGNYWFGNEFIHLLTRQNAFSVRFVIIDSDGKIKHADYDNFEVDSEENDFALRLGNYSGDAGDVLTTMSESGIHDNMRFSTEDNDNDRRTNVNCALDNAGGWWYDNCYSALLTSGHHIYWKGLCTDIRACKLASIMIRPNGKNCNLPPRYN